MTIHHISALIVLSVVLGGCGSGLMVQISLDPDSSFGTATEIKADSTEGKSKKYAGQMTNMSLRQGPDIVAYRFTSNSAVDGYVETVKKLSPEDIRKLPKVDGKRHRVELEVSNEYVLIDQLIPIYDPETDVFIGRYRKVRAWRDVRGDEKASVGRVFTGLEDGAGIRGMDIAPDGSQLVFGEALPVIEGSDAIRPQANNIVKLQLCNMKAIRLLTSGGAVRAGGVAHIRRGDYRDLDPSFTYDGRIVFSTNRRRHDSADMALVSAVGRQGGMEFPPGISTGDETILCPSAARDGSIAYMVYDRHSSVPQIWCLRPGGFPNYLCDGSQPKISPDGKRIAYLGADRNLWVTSSDGTNPTRLTHEAEDLLRQYFDALTDTEKLTFDAALFSPYSFPTWMPDGEKILYTSMEGVDSTNRPNDDIWIVGVDSSSPMQLTTNGSTDSNPMASPDGRFVFFLSNRGGEWAVWAIERTDALALGD